MKLELISSTIADAVTVMIGELVQAAQAASPMVGTAIGLYVMKVVFPTFTDWVDKGLVTNAEKVIKAISEVSRARGLSKPTKEASTSLLLPLLEAAVLENDDVLRQHWAEMFANAIDANSKIEVRRAYVSILQDCSRMDLENLAKLHAVPPGKDGRTVKSALLPEKAEPLYAGYGDSVEGLPKPEVVRSLWNLVRLGLVSGEQVGGGDDRLIFVTITALGDGLVEACTAPRPD